MKHYLNNFQTNGTDDMPALKGINNFQVAKFDRD